MAHKTAAGKGRGNLTIPCKAEGKQRYRCKHPSCPIQTFLVEYSHHDRVPEVKQQILEMTLNGSGIRDIARVLRISPTTVIEELKKEPQLQHVNDLAIQDIDPREICVEIQQVEEAKIDEM